MILKVDGGFNEFHSDVYNRMMNELRDVKKLQTFVRRLFTTEGSLSGRFCVF